ncbi:hypothetical protein OIO90_005502 [Microbotryomycetes sp. JL221]|nr:hypothetical protein OIO90_005502 [Microbotryomycetes sp. JL221]
MDDGGIPPTVLRFFAAAYPTLEFEPTWLNDCCDYIRSTTDNLTPNEFNKKVEFQLLNSSLSTSTISSNKLLPLSQQDIRIESSFNRTFAQIQSTKGEPVILFPTKKQAVLVQIDKVDDVASSALDMSDVLQDQTERRSKLVRRQQQQQAGQDGRQQDEDGPQIEDEPKVFKRGTLKLWLSDGHSEMQAFEWKPIPQLGPIDQVQLGAKMLIWNVRVVRGILMLSPDSVVWKGHQVEEMQQNALQDLENTLRMRLGKRPLRREERNVQDEAIVIDDDQDPVERHQRQRQAARPQHRGALSSTTLKQDDTADMDDFDDDGIDLDAIEAIEQAAMNKRQSTATKRKAEELEVIELSD